MDEGAGAGGSDEMAAFLAQIQFGKERVDEIGDIAGNKQASALGTCALASGAQQSVNFGG